MTIRIAKCWLWALLGAMTAAGGLRVSGAERAGGDLRREARAVIGWERTSGLPLQPRIRHREERDGLLRERVSFLGAPGQVVPALVTRPAGARARLPAVVALHGL